MKLSCVIVSHNMKNYIGRCIDSVRTALADIRSLVGEAEIIVVDRGSTDGTANAARTAYADVTIVDVPFDAGWATAANKGACAATGETLLFVSPEVELLSGGLPRLLEHLETNPACAIAGGAVVSTSGALLHGPARFPGLLGKLAALTGLGSRFPRTMLDWTRYGGRNLDLPLEVDSVSFDYAVVKAAAFCKLGRFDARFHTAFADTDLCRRASRTMLPRPTVAFVPQARARAQDNFVLRDEMQAFDLHGTAVVRGRVRCEMLYVWKNYCILTSLANTTLELVGQACRYAMGLLPVIGCDKTARHSAAVLKETAQAALDTQLGSQYPTTPW